MLSFPALLWAWETITETFWPFLEDCATHSCPYCHDNDGLKQHKVISSLFSGSKVQKESAWLKRSSAFGALGEDVFLASSSFRKLPVLVAGDPPSSNSSRVFPIASHYDSRSALLFHPQDPTAALGNPPRWYRIICLKVI